MLRLAEGSAERDAVAEPARARIDADMERAEPSARAALEHLRAHLFDPALNVKTLRRATRNTSSRFFHAFRAATDESPKRYIDSLRLKTAAALLRSTALPIHEIARLAGYGALETFRTRFSHAYGALPSRYRAAGARQDPAATTPDEDSDALDIEAPLWRRFFTSWSAAEHRSAPPWTAEERRASARRRAEQAWDVARNLGAAARRQLVASVGQTTPALIEHLFARGRIEGRGNRAWGIQVAELALGAIPQHPNDAWTVSHLCEARVRAHAWLGNAHRLTLDFPKAEAAFEKARRLIEDSSHEASPRARAECARLEAGLYWTRCEYQRARELADEAVNVAEREGLPDLLVPALRWRAAIAADRGELEDSIRDFRKCLELLPSDAPGEERLPIHQALAQNHLLLEQAREAAEELELAEQQCAALRDPRATAFLALARGRLEWLRGNLRKAVDSLEEALRGFQAQEARFDILVAMTDLCIVNLEAGEAEIAFDMARQLLPALRFLGADDEWHQLVRELQACVTRRKLELALLRRVRGALPRLPRHGSLQGSRQGA